MLKRQYAQIYIPASLLNQNVRYCFNQWNRQFWDENGKFKRKGARLLSDGHQRVIESIAYIMVNRTSLKNRQNKKSKTIKPFFINDPITFMVNTNDIRNVMTKKMKLSVSLRTIRNRIDRLSEAGIINKEFNKAKGRYSMFFSPFLLPVMDNKDGKILKHSNFLDLENEQITPDHRKDLPDYINSVIKKEIKKEQYSIVDKGTGASTQNNTLIPEQPKLQGTPEAIEKTPSLQTKTYTKKIARIFGLPKDQVRGLAADMENNLPEKLYVNKTLQKANQTKHKEELFKRLRKNAALAFYVRFIITFYAWTRKNYLPETAGISTIFYVEQALEELETNKDYYFGACKTEEHLQYQGLKLEKALKSTFMYYQAKLKKDPNYNWKHNYPNTFLSKQTGKNSFSFKSSVLHVEKAMIRTNEINAEYENQMTSYKLQKIKTEQDKQIHTAAWYIYQNSNRVAENINIALDYFKNDEQKCNNFKSFILNQWAVKKWIRENEKFKPDNEMITDCFVRHDKLKQEINELMPDVQKKIRYSEKNRAKVARYLNVSSDFMPEARFYNEQTYNFVSNFIS